jgi:hypothetical protein
MLRGVSGTMGQPDRNDECRGHKPRAGEPAGDGGPDEAARYLAAAVADLGLIARRHGLGTLGFLRWRRWKLRTSSGSAPRVTGPDRRAL